jgi:hypothetical protein
MGVLKLVCATALFTVAGGVASAVACTNANLVGVWGIETIQTASHPGVAVGQITFDGTGNLTASVTDSENGTIFTGTFAGTYSVAKNCTVAVTFDFGGGSTSTATFVLHMGNKALEAITTEAPVVERGFGYARGALVCGLTGKKETFAVNTSGVVPGTGPTAGVGQIILDGKGNLTGTLVWSVGGTVNTAPITGTYTENADCTGTATVTPSGFPSSHYNLAIVKARSTVLIIQTDSGTVLAGTLQK